MTVQYLLVLFIQSLFHRSLQTCQSEVLLYFQLLHSHIWAASSKTTLKNTKKQQLWRYDLPRFINNATYQRMRKTLSKFEFGHRFEKMKAVLWVMAKMCIKSLAVQVNRIPQSCKVMPSIIKFVLFCFVLLCFAQFVWGFFSRENNFI